MAIPATAVAVCLVAVMLGAQIRWLSLSKPPRAGEDLRWLSLSEPPEPTAEVAVLEHWDHRRARAYSRGDAGALRQLYARGSQAGARDVQLLQSYADRGLVVTDMRIRLLSVEVFRRGRHRLVLQVRDRLARATATSRIDESVHRRLPTDHPSTHLVTLTRTGDNWLVTSVR